MTSAACCRAAVCRAASRGNGGGHGIGRASEGADDRVPLTLFDRSEPAVRLDRLTEQLGGQAIASCINSGVASQRRDEPSTSVNRNVTVPVGISDGVALTSLPPVSIADMSPHPGVELANSPAVPRRTGPDRAGWRGTGRRAGPRCCCPPGRGGAKVPRPPLPGETVTMPLLPGRPRRPTPARGRAVSSSPVDQVGQLAMRSDHVRPIQSTSLAYLLGG